MIASAADMWGNVCATLVIAKSEGDNIKFPFDEIKPPSE
jgi:Na+/H+-dicarboxylate symporter